MARFRCAVVPLLILTFLVVGAGELLYGKRPPKLTYPCGATAVHVLTNSYCGETMGIEVRTSAAVEDILCPGCVENPSVNCPHYMIGWIGGTVIADPTKQHGFYFDPNTIAVFELVLEGYQSSICQIAENPDIYNGTLRFIPYLPLEIRPL